MIYEDNDILVCHKPAGIATQTKRLGQQDMESLLKNYRVKKGEPPYIGIVHRLDQPVEGIMVFAKNQKSASALSKQIQNKMIGKYYYAVSACKPKEEQGVLENYLITDKKTNFTRVVEENLLKNCNEENFSEKETVASGEKYKQKSERTDKKGNKNEQSNLIKEAKFAKLEYRVVTSIGEKTLFDIKLHTGRQHQIRVQMAHMGCHLIGDEKYGVKSQEMECGISFESINLHENAVNTDLESSVYNRQKKSLKSQNTIALCSYRLQFEHPTTKKQMDFSIFPKGNVFQGFKK